MFRNLRKGLSGLIDKLKYRRITDGDVEGFFDDLQILLLENDVSYEVTMLIYNSLRERVRGVEFPRFSDFREYLISILKDIINNLLDEAGAIDFIEYVKKSDKSPFVAVFLGVNGVGKTTTIAKLTHLFIRRGSKVVLACSDTFRAGAIEQIKIHASRLSVPLIAQSYGADPAAVAYDAIEHARSRSYDVVFIDTAGRQHSNVNLMEELKKIVRVVEPQFNILVVDALTGQDALNQAKEFNSYVGVDGVIFTKVDSDVKGGSILSVAATIKKPILYLGVGQGYEDLILFDKNMYIRNILGE